MSFMDERFLDVDQHGVLKPPWSLWFCTVFLLRHWLLMAVIAASSRRSPETVQWLYSALSWPLLLLELPMLLLVAAWGRRVPEAGRWARLCWRRGREIIGLTATLNLVWAIHFLVGQDEWMPWPERVVLLLAALEVLIIVFVWRSPLYAQLFREFPQARTAQGNTP